jgi:exodeoxyribonuclease V alpha subunit
MTDSITADKTHIDSGNSDNGKNNTGGVSGNAKNTANTANTVVINGIIKKIIFQNQENGFTILNIFSSGRFITASGSIFDKPIPDSKIKLKGEFIHHKKYGYQFSFSEYEISLSNSKTAVIDYLSSNIFKGIGKVLANQIYEKFKEKTLEIIDNDPERLKEVGGIGRVKLSTIIEGLKESYGLRKAIMFFKPYQFSDYQIKSIYNQFQEKSIAVAKENPYLFTEIKGIGFKKADIMAEKLGIKKDDPNRIKEAVKYVIGQLCEQSGNCFVYYKDIKKGINEIIIENDGINSDKPDNLNGADKNKADSDKPDISLDDELLNAYINDLVKEKKLIIDLSPEDDNNKKNNSDINSGDDYNFHYNQLNQYNYIINKAKIYLPVYYYSEIGVAKELKRISGTSCEVKFNKETTYKLSEKDSLTLTGEQKNAVQNALNYKISVISGGPGTGKSTVIKTIAGLYADKKIALISLSGKAAQRLSAIIESGNLNKENIAISTIHRLLKAQFDRNTNESVFLYNETNKLPHDLIVIDEMSMVDILIFYKLLKAVKDDAVLVLVGDVNQIPSVSPGDVLRDIIKTEKFFPATFLNKVFRQNEGGLINLNAHNLLNNKKFITAKQEDGRKEFIIKYRKEYDTAQSGKDELLKDFEEFIKKIASKRLSAGKKINSFAFDDIQVLTPMRKGILGYNNLNKIIQETFNPNPLETSTAKAISVFPPDSNSAAKNENIKEDNHNVNDNINNNLNQSSSFIYNGIQFKLYDKIIQKKNNYDLEVFNGDTGYIINIDHEEKTVSVDFSDYFPGKNRILDDINYIGEDNDKNRIVKYDFLDVYENIMPAYALSIHKAQGSEFNNVIVLFHQSHFMMLKKNLLYTAITRGKKNVVIFGTYKAFGIAMNSKEEIRNSGLKERITEVFDA